MKLKWVVNPSTGKQDPLLTMSVLVVTAAAVKFVLEGVNLTISGHAVDFGHADSLTYAALLSPVLGIHGYVKGLREKKSPPRQQVDNPDEESNDNQK